MSLRLHYFKILKRSHSLSLKEKFTVRKEMKCVGNSEILHEIVCDTTHISSCFFNFCVVSQTILCSISESLEAPERGNNRKWQRQRSALDPFKNMQDRLAKESLEGFMIRRR